MIDYTFQQALDMTCRTKWRGKKTELELYGRAVMAIMAVGQDSLTHTTASISTYSLLKAQRKLLDQGRAPATVNRIMSALGVVLHVARSAGGQAPPLPTGLKEQGKDPRAFTTSELSKILEALPPDSTAKMLARFLVGSGLRVGEALALTNGQVEMGNTSWVRFRREKSGRETRVPLPLELRGTVSTLWARQLGPVYTGTRDGVVWEDQDRVPDTQLFDIKYRQFLLLWTHAVESVLGYYDGRTMGPHSLRRTFATRLSVKGVALPVIQRLLGHRNIQTTMRYVAVTDDDLQKAVS